MNLRTIILFAVAVTLIGSAAIAMRFAGQRALLRGAHTRMIQQRERDWAQQKLQAELAAREAALRKETEARERALGGPLPAALKDPNLDIATMLRRVAQECAGRGARSSLAAAPG